MNPTFTESTLLFESEERKIDEDDRGDDEQDEAGDGSKGEKGHAEVVVFDHDLVLAVGFGSVEHLISRSHYRLDIPFFAQRATTSAAHETDTQAGPSKISPVIGGRNTIYDRLRLLPVTFDERAVRV